MMWQTVAVMVSVTGLAFFALRWAQLRRSYRALSSTERRRAEIEALREKAEQRSFHDKVRAEMERLGLGANLMPFYGAVAVVYLAVAAPMTLLSIPTLVGLAVALPVALGSGYVAVVVRARKRRSAFNKQLVDLLDLTVSQIKGGVGAERALQIVVPQLPDPIRSEMLVTLAAGQAGKDLVAAMSELRDRYPSRAFDMFIAALEIDRAEGQAIAPALDQAAALLKQDFALAAEARSNLAQVKYEFYAVAGIVAGLGVMLVFGGGEEMTSSYFTPGGLLVIAIAVGNGAVGFFRFHRKLSNLTGDTQ